MYLKKILIAALFFLAPLTSLAAFTISQGGTGTSTFSGGGFIFSDGGTTPLYPISASTLGYVVGPASATDNAVTRYDGTTGKLIQDSPGVLIDDLNNLRLDGSLVDFGNTTNNAKFTMQFRNDQGITEYPVGSLGIGDNQSDNNFLYERNHTISLFGANGIGLNTRTPFVNTITLGRDSNTIAVDRYRQGATSGNALNLKAGNASYSNFVNSYNITDGGEGYKVGGAFYIQSSGEQAWFKVNSIHNTIGVPTSTQIHGTDVGTGYNVNDTVTVINGDNNLQLFITAVDISGGVQSYNLYGEGTSYVTGDYSVSGGSGSGLIITVNSVTNHTDSLNSISLIDVGSGFSLGNYTANGGATSQGTIYVTSIATSDDNNGGDVNIYGGSSQGGGGSSLYVYLTQEGQGSSGTTHTPSQFLQMRNTVNNGATLDFLGSAESEAFLFANNYSLASYYNTSASAYNYSLFGQNDTFSGGNSYLNFTTGNQNTFYGNQNLNIGFNNFYGNNASRSVGIGQYGIINGNNSVGIGYSPKPLTSTSIQISSNSSNGAVIDNNFTSITNRIGLGTNFIDSDLDVSLGSNNNGSDFVMGLNRLAAPYSTQSFNNSNLILRAGGAGRNGQIQQFNINNSGSNYKIGDVLQASGGGNDAYFFVSSESSGSISSLILIKGGSGYSNSANYTLSGGSGSSGEIQTTQIYSNTDTDGGNLTLSSGLAVGDGGSDLIFKTVREAQGSGNTDRQPEEFARFHNETFSLGSSSFSQIRQNFVTSGSTGTILYDGSTDLFSIANASEWDDPLSLYRTSILKTEGITKYGFYSTDGVSQVYGPNGNSFALSAAGINANGATFGTSIYAGIFSGDVVVFSGGSGTGNLALEGKLFVGDGIYDNVSPTLSIDVNNRFLVDSSANPLLKWDSGYLLDRSGTTVADWVNTILFDSSHSASADWNSRILYGDWKFSAGLIDGSNSLGNAGDILSSTGSATAWVSPTSLPVINLLSTTSGIDGKTVANTAAWTNPSGSKQAIITGYSVRVSSASSITVGPAAGIGNVAGTSNIVASQAMNALITTTTNFQWQITGMSVPVPASGTVYFNLDTAATGSSETLVVDLYGYITP